MNLKEYIQSEIKSQLGEAKDMTFVDYLKVLDSKFLDGMKAVRGDNGSDAAITPTRGDILQNFKLFRNYLSALTKKYKGDKTKLRFISEHTNKFNETIESVINEVCWDNYKQVGMKTKGGKQVPNCVPEGLKEGIMSDIHLTIKSSSTEDEFIKKFFKQYGKQVKPNKESIEWVKGLYSDVKNESVNEAKKKLPNFKKIPSWAKYVAQASDGEWTWYEDTPTMIKFKDGGGAWKQDGNQTYTGVKTNGKDWDKIPTYYNVKNGVITESVNESPDVNSLKKIHDAVLKFLKTKKGVGEVKEFPEFPNRYGDNVSTFSVKYNIEDKYNYDLQEIKIEYSTSRVFIPNKGYFPFKTFNDIKNIINKKSSLKESVNEEQIDEKLITFSNRAPYGQIVFMAGGAGSGKGFAIDNFIDSAGFKVRDVDEMKKAVGKLDQLGKFSVDKWYKKYGKTLSDKPGKGGGLSPKAHIEEFVLGKGMSISDIASDLKSPNNVASLHYIVDSMGLKDKWLVSMLSGKNNKETLPNLLFDITAKKVSSITDVIKPLIEAGYNSKNVHLIWVLKNYHAAVEANKTRDRVVPDDILLQTHEGASKTMWQVLTKIKPKGLDGRIDVILNNNKFTAKFVDSNGKEIQVEPNQMNKLKKAQPVVSGFKSLPIKKQGGGIIPEKYWQGILKGWILSNTPDTIDFEELEKPPKEKKK